MANLLRLIPISVLSLFLFQNCGEMTAQEAEYIFADSTDDLKTSSITQVSYGNNSQTIGLNFFGANVRGQDTRQMMNLNSRRGMWTNLRDKGVGNISLNILLIDNTGVFYNSTTAAQVAFSNGELDEFKKIQNSYISRVDIEMGMSLQRHCSERNLTILARKSVDMDMQVLNRLISRGIKLHSLNIDGPFLHLVNLSRKAGSCATQGKGFNITQTVEATARYLTELKNRVSAAQGQNVKIGVIINLPNWRVDEQMELAWGTWKNQEINLRQVLNAFNDYENYPNIYQIILDYPYGVLADHQQRVIDSRQPANVNLCGSVNHCRRISGPASFNAKVQKLYGIMQNIKGDPLLSFFVNTDGSLNSCLNYGNMQPLLVPYKNNKCLDSAYPLARLNREMALADQDRRDERFYAETRAYYKLVKHHMPAGIRVGNAYMKSWTAGPRLMTVYAAKTANMVSQ